MSIWLDGIVEEQTWREQAKRLLIVCPEPNEAWMEHRGDQRRDSRELLRSPEAVRKPFYIRLRQVVRAFHSLPSRSDRGEEREHLELLRRIAFMNLKNTGGGSSADKGKVMKATESRRAELIEKVRRVGPSHIAVAGEKAQDAFDRYIRHEMPSSVSVCGIYHPSCRMGYDEYYRHVQTQMASEFPKDPR